MSLDVARSAITATVDAVGPADIVFGNLEAMLSRESTQTSRMHRDQMRGPPEFVELLRGTFDIVSVANNHADQHGDAAFDDTIRLLDGAEIQYCGLPGDAPWSSRPVVMDRGGRRLGFLGYSLRPPQYWPGVRPYALGDPTRIEADVRRLSGESDHVVVSLHWGEEFVGTPSQAEQTLAHRIIGAGAACILGHHPHVTRQVEVLEEGGVIAYSLGNFVSDMVWLPELSRGRVLSLTFEGDSVLAATVDTTIGANYLPSVASERVDLLPGPIRALPDAEYEEATARSLLRQRKALYGYFIRNAFRFPAHVFIERVIGTIRNRLSEALPSRRTGRLDDS